MQTLKRPESVLVVVHTPDGQVLMLERASPRGFWQSVTGSLEWGEAPLFAAIRELGEEVGTVDAEIRDLKETRRFPILPAWRARYAPDVAENVEHWFAAQVSQPFSPALSEHADARWLPWREAAALASSWTNREAIETLFGGLM